MKLKKIASLALAGVMAMSMLAGCAEANANSVPTTPSTPVATEGGKSEVFNSRLSSLAQYKINMSDDADLSADLNTAIENLGSATIIDFTTAIRAASNIRTVVNFDTSYFLMNNMGIFNNVPAGDLSVIAGEMGAVSQSTAFAQLVPAYNEFDDETVVMLYAVDGTLSADAAVKQVADEVNWEIEQLRIDDDNSPDINEGVDATTLHYEYNGSVSVASRYLEANHGIGMHIVAVQITRTVA